MTGTGTLGAVSPVPLRTHWASGRVALARWRQPGGQQWPSTVTASTATGRDNPRVAKQCQLTLKLVWGVLTGIVGVP